MAFHVKFNADEVAAITASDTTILLIYQPFI